MAAKKRSDKSQSAGAQENSWERLKLEVKELYVDPLSRIVSCLGLVFVVAALILATWCFFSLCYVQNELNARMAAASNRIKYNERYQLLYGLYEASTNKRKEAIKEMIRESPYFTPNEQDEITQINNIHLAEKYAYARWQKDLQNDLAGSAGAEERFSDIGGKKISQYGAQISLCGSLILAAAGCGTVVSLRMSRLQQRFSEKWKSLEFVTNELRRFQTDERVTNGKTILEGISATYDTALCLYFDPALLHENDRSCINPLLALPKQSEGIGANRSIALGISKYDVRVNKQILLNAFTPNGFPSVNIKTGRCSVGPHKHTYLENKIAYELDAILEPLSSFIKIVEFNQNQRDFEMVDWSMLYEQLDWWTEAIIGSAVLKDDGAENWRLQLMLYQYLWEYYEDELIKKKQFRLHIIAAFRFNPVNFAEKWEKAEAFYSDKQNYQQLDSDKVAGRLAQWINAESKTST